MTKKEITAVTDKIIRQRTPDSSLVQYEPRVMFLDTTTHNLSREETARIIAIGDRTAISYEHLTERVVNERGQMIEKDGEVTDKNSGFLLMYALSARGSKEIAHTSIREQINAGPTEFGGDPPILIQGYSAKTQLLEVVAGEYLAGEYTSSRGAIYPKNYHRPPKGLRETPVYNDLQVINKEVEEGYRFLLRRALEHYVEVIPKLPEELEPKKNWLWEWRVLSYALDDARQATNLTFLQQGAIHPNNALALGETISSLSASTNPETRDAADRLRALGQKGLPTLMKYTEATPFQCSLPEKRRKITRDLGLDLPAEAKETFLKIEKIAKPGLVDRPTYNRDERAVTVSEDPARMFLAAFLANEGGRPMMEVYDRLGLRTAKEVGEAINAIFDGMTIHDKPPKELKLIQITAQELLTVGGIFDSLRHRVGRHIIGQFTPYQGFVIPETFGELGLAKEYSEIIKANEKGYKLIAGLGQNYEDVFASYFVARGHLQHYTLRMDGHGMFHYRKVRSSKSHPDLSLATRELGEVLDKISPIIFDRDFTEN